VTDAEDMYETDMEWFVGIHDYFERKLMFARVVKGFPVGLVEEIEK